MLFISISNDRSLLENVENLDEKYSIIAEQLFYELDDKFRLDPIQFFPIRMLLQERGGKYNLSVCLALGWYNRLTQEEDNWLMERLNKLNDGILYVCSMGDTFSKDRIVFEMRNQDFPREDTDDYLDHPYGAHRRRPEDENEDNENI